jgi:hypothetical protein
LAALFGLVNRLLGDILLRDLASIRPRFRYQAMLQLGDCVIHPELPDKYNFFMLSGVYM